MDGENVQAAIDRTQGQRAAFRLRGKSQKKTKEKENRKNLSQDVDRRGFDGGGGGDSQSGMVANVLK